MKNPDENYNWDNAIGKAFHIFVGYGNQTGPSCRGIITKHAKSRVYYRPTYGICELHCQKRTISLVEVEEKESLKISLAYREMNVTIKAAKISYKNFINDLCQ